MQKRKRVGVYGGTFDPIHFGHLNAALAILEYHNLDEVWFCPAYVNPHKAGRNCAPAQHRLKMLELAIADLPHFHIVPLELHREGPSYTIDTLRDLTAKHSEEVEFFFIIGEDSMADFFHWREPREIIKLAPLLIAKRFSLENPTHLGVDSEIEEALKKGITPTPFMEISASNIRQRILKGQYIGHLVPSKVVDYIYNNRLYS